MAARFHNYHGQPEVIQESPSAEDVHESTNDGQKREEKPAVGEEEKMRHDSNTTQASSALAQQTVFDPLNGGQDGIHYKSMTWWQAGVLMLAETISLGILALPGAMAKIGLIPGLVAIIGLGILATYSGYVIGQFREAHNTVHNFMEAAEILAGKWGRRMMMGVTTLFFVFIMAAHILTFAVAMNVLTGHSICTVFFSVIGLVISLICNLPRTLAKVSYLSICSCLSVLCAVFTTMAALGVEKRHPANINLANYVSFAATINAILNITIAYAGNVAFFSFISELKNPKDFTKSLLLLQITAVTIYCLVAAVIYAYVGSGVPSPALSAASPTVRKVAYGLALPTIIIAGVVNGAVAIKAVFMRFWQSDPRVIAEKSFRAWGSWIAIVVIMWFAAWILAELIPIFSVLLGLISALFGSWFTYGSSGFLWLHLHRGHWFSTRKQCFLAMLNIGMLVLAAALCGLGMWASIVDLKNAKVGRPFSCKDTSPV